MYIINGICHAGEYKEDIKVTDVKPLSGRMLLLTFSTGEKRLCDTTIFDGPVMEPLNNPEIFNNPVIDFGTVTWNNGEIDIAPETLYVKSYPYEDKNILKANLLC